ncbi:hypothetical protein ZWY2020_057549 [Hordeum vulgare]|nr:hypothetical protein ZWY2020_057549 [Hordeum vulgare]
MRLRRPRAVLPPTVALPQWICPSKPDAVLALLAGLGLYGADVAALVAMDPQFLCVGMESNLRPAAVGLTGLGLSRSAPRLHTPAAEAVPSPRAAASILVPPPRRPARFLLLLMLMMDPWHSVFSCSVAMYLPGVVLPACSALAVVSVLGFPDGEDYVPSMRQGFLLEWTVPSDDCPKCEASGKAMRIAAAPAFLRLLVACTPTSAVS